MTEIWKPIPDDMLPPSYRGHYEASTHGRIRSLPRTITTSAGVVRRLSGGIRKPSPNPRGGHLTLGRAGSVHRLVAATFNGPIPPGMEVRHRNGIPTDNRPENLTHGTRADNMQDRIAHGNNPQANRTHCPRNHPLIGPNLKRRSSPTREWRNCRACENGRYWIATDGLDKQEAGDLALARILDKAGITRADLDDMLR